MDVPRKYHNYVYETFQCFRKSRTTLKFDIHAVKEVDEKIQNLIMYQLIKTDISKFDIPAKINAIEGEQGSIPYRNLFKKEVLNIFVNVKKIEFRLFIDDYITIYYYIYYLLYY